MPFLMTDSTEEAIASLTFEDGLAEPGGGRLAAYKLFSSVSEEETEEAFMFSSPKIDSEEAKEGAKLFPSFINGSAEPN